MKMKSEHIDPFREALKQHVANDWKGRQGQLAIDAKISHPYLSEIIGLKEKVPSQEAAERIANACGKTYDEFLQYGKELLKGATAYKKKEHFHKLIKAQVSTISAFKEIYEKAYPGKELPTFFDVEKYLPPKKHFDPDDDQHVSAEDFLKIAFSFQDFHKAKDIIECLLTIEFGDPDAYDEIHTELKEKARLTHKKTIKLLTEVKTQTEDLLKKMMKAYEKNKQEESNAPNHKKS